MLEAERVEVAEPPPLSILSQLLPWRFFVWWFLRFVFLNFEHCFPLGAAFSAHLWIRGKGVEFPAPLGE